MENVVLILFLAGVIIFILYLLNSSKKGTISKLENTIAQERDLALSKVEKIQSQKREKSELIKLQKEQLRDSDIRHDGILKILKERAKFFPWLSTAFADFETYLGDKEASALLSKKRPAPKAADKVKKFSRRAASAEKKFRHIKYRIDLYEKYFPWITEVTGDTLDEFLNDLEAPLDKVSVDEKGNDDPVRNHISKYEYEKLTPCARSQLAFDRWKRSRKTNWQIGREYERFIGYTYEKKGFKVEYYGAVKGLDDLGRDLIASKDGKIEIIQCKYWAKSKTIHEKHVFQLYGTVIEHTISNNQSGENLPLFSKFTELSNIKPVFITSTTLSERASSFAELLEVEVRENVELSEYPQIKCNISKTTDERVYHMPFDQQYDRTIIEPGKGEFYAWTAKEAEAAGFRRAYRWRPSTSI